MVSGIRICTRLSVRTGVAVLTYLQDAGLADRRDVAGSVKGQFELIVAEPSGCRFEPRCPLGRGRDICRQQEPPLAEHAPGQWAACHFPGELTAAT